MPRYDVQEVKSAAAGRWPEIISAIAGISIAVLDGAHHPCPKCGGDDRFNLSREGTGSAYCNHCQSGGTGNGIDAIAWLTGRDFNWSREAVAKYLGIDQSKAAVDRDLCHEVYSKLASTFGLNEKHRNDLRQRGLTDDEIDYRGYWSAPSKGVDTIRLANLFDDRQLIAEHVPGVFPGGAIRINATEALMIPVRSAAGKIVGIQYRMDNPSKSGSRYFWLSSGKQGGPSPGSPGHVTLPPRESHDLKQLRVTEGPLKADIATALSGIRSVACAGVNNWKSIVDLVSELSPDQIILAFDNDAKINAGVAKATVNTYDHFLAGKSMVYVEDWPEDQKGIDDALLRSKVVILPLEDGFKKIDRLRRFVENTDSPEHPDDPHRLARVNLEQYEAKGRTLRYWKGSWYSYKGTHYVEIDKDYFKSRIAGAIKQEFDRLQEDDYEKYIAWKRSSKYEEHKDKGPPKARKINDPLTNSVILATKSMCVLSPSIAMPCWIPDRTRPNYVAATNGILDLDAIMNNEPIEKALLPHSKDWFSSFCLSYPFDPTASCDRWIEYLDYVMEGDAERISLLQEWAGYLLTNRNNLQKFLVLEGEGKNGKTVFFAAITAMLGESNVSNVSIENFGGRFDLTSSIGKAVNICGDAGEIELVAEGILKQFTGGDVMQFDRKNQSPISLRPTAKLMCAWNTRPKFRDKSSGLWRRMLLVPFNREVEEHRRVLDMDQAEWWLKQGEVAGILNWAIVGLNRLLENKRFSHSTISENAISEYREESNPAIEFINQNVCYLPRRMLESEVCKEPKNQHCISSTKLYRQYREWCVENGVHPMNANNFGKQIVRKFGKIKYRRPDGDREYVYRLICYHGEYEK